MLFRLVIVRDFLLLPTANMQLRFVLLALAATAASAMAAKPRGLTDTLSSAADAVSSAVEDGIDAVTSAVEDLLPEETAAPEANDGAANEGFLGNLGNDGLANGGFANDGFANDARREAPLGCHDVFLGDGE